jgi:hypothetical protein
MKYRTPYELLSDSKIEPNAKAGSIVYRVSGYDYGLSRDDTRMTGIEHVSVTFSPEGDYPSFTHPLSALKEIIKH